MTLGWLAKKTKTAWRCIVDPGTRGRAWYYACRRPAAFAPYSLALYRGFLNQLKQHPDIRVLPFAAGPDCHPVAARFYLRHDIDTAECADRMHLLLEENLAASLPAAAFLLLYGSPYDLRGIRAKIQHWRARGVEMGLHTCCYTENDYLGCFRREIREFTNQLGFPPRTFTVHGLGPVRCDYRMRFYEDIAPVLAEYGFIASDIPPLRSYDYMMEDCNLDQHGRRFVYGDFANMPSFIRPGYDYVALTHPCYWRP